MANNETGGKSKDINQSQNRSGSNGFDFDLPHPSKQAEERVINVEAFCEDV